MDNRKLLEKVGEGCSAQIECSKCTEQVWCRKDIYEQHPELKKIFGEKING